MRDTHATSMTWDSSRGGHGCAEPQRQRVDKNVLVDVQEPSAYFNYGLGLNPDRHPAITAVINTQAKRCEPARLLRRYPPGNLRGEKSNRSLKTQRRRLQQRALVSYDVLKWFNRDFAYLHRVYDNTTGRKLTFTSQRWRDQCKPNRDQ